MADALLRGKFNEAELNQRQKLSYILIVGTKTTIFTGKEAEKFVKSLGVEEVETSEISGHCACPGTAKGVVRIINVAKDMEKMKQGDILVAHMTNPELVPAMKKASAIVSRELGIPCITGTKVATKWLKDGDLVAVDASAGTVKKISA